MIYKLTHRNFKPVSLLLLITFLAGFNIHAQKAQITGKVIDNNGALPGVNVIIKGTNNGTETDFDGNYRLPNVPSDATLVFSFIGYKTQEVPINGKSTINLTMQEDLQTLEEVVIVAYGSQSRTQVTGAISSVGAEEIAALPVATADQALQGRAAGVTITNSGSPGTAPTVRIRGVGSPNGGNPLYVIDGVISTGLGSINPNDIESVNVLKDAATAAAYGSQAANGVIIVTTKQGKSGRTEFSFNNYTGVQFVTNRFNLLNTEQYLQYIEEAFGDVPTSSLSTSGLNTDWQDAIFQLGLMQNYDFSMSGGSDRSNFRASLGMLKQEGTIINTGYNRYNIRVNSNFDISDKLKVGETLAVTFNDRKPEVGADNTGSRSLLEHAIKAAPYLPVYNENNLGGYQGPTKSSDIQDAENPVRIQELGNRLNTSSQIFGSVYGEYELLEGLKFKSQFGLEYNHNNYNEFIPSFDDDSSPTEATHSQPFATIVKNSSQFKRLLYTNSLNYNFTLNDNHNFDLLVLAEKNDSFYNATNASSRNSVTDDIDQLTNEQASVSSVTDEISKIGYLGRLNYNYNDTYLLSASIRRDGSSVFGSDKWGWFPSVSAGWNIAKEKFLNDSMFDMLKLRGSWGVTGFDGISNYRYITTLEQNYNYVINNNQVSGVAPASTENSRVAWEGREMLNIGLDFAINNKFTGAIEYYVNTSNDLLLDLPSPGSIGNPAGSIPTNIGNAETKGFEFNFGYNDSKGDFTWSANLNLSTAETELLKKGTEGLTPFSTFEGSTINGLTVGDPIFAFYGYQTNGIYQTDGEVQEVLGTSQTAIKPGDIRFIDQLTVDSDGDGVVDSGDGIINENDIVMLGDPTPNITFGLNLNGYYKNWDINLFINGAAGHQIFNSNIFDLQGMPRAFNAGVEVLNRWTEDGENALTTNVPRASDGNNNINYASSDRYIEDGDFARLKNLTIGYTLPEMGGLTSYFSKLRVYASGQNLLTLTNYSGLDPEIGNSKTNAANNNSEFGVDRGNYPQPKSVLIGLQLTF